MELDLENDLMLSQEDIEYLKRNRLSNDTPPDLSAYLAFLEGIRAFYTRKPPIRPYCSDFEL
jgi:hypothetical protein